MSDKPRVLVIGGKRKNVPAWADAAFEIELLDQDSPKARIEQTERAPSAIVVYTGAVSHQHSGQAHELGADLDVPVLKARNGWSTAVEQAAQIGATWFVDAVQLGAQAISDKNPPRAKEGLEAVDNAWRVQAEIEVEKREALEKRLRKVQGKLDKAQETIDRLRSGAEERVLNAIRQSAAEVRREREVVARERKAVLSLARDLANQLTNWVDEGSSVLEAMEDAEKSLQGEVDSDPA